MTRRTKTRNMIIAVAAVAFCWVLLAGTVQTNHQSSPENQASRRVLSFNQQDVYQPEESRLILDELLDSIVREVAEKEDGADEYLFGFSFRAENVLPRSLRTRMQQPTGCAFEADLSHVLVNTGIWHRFRLKIPYPAQVGNAGERHLLSADPDSSVLEVSVDRDGPGAEEYTIQDIFLDALPSGKLACTNGNLAVCWQELRPDTIYGLEMAEDLTGRWHTVTSIVPTASTVLQAVDMDRNRSYYRLAIPSVQVDTQSENEPTYEGSTVLSNSVQFGNFEFDLPTPASSKGQDGAYHEYQVSDAGFNFNIPHSTLSNLLAYLEDVELSFKMNPANPTQFKEISATWSGLKTFSFGLLDLELSELALTITSNGLLSADVALCASVSGDQELRPHIWLCDDIGGCASVSYSNASDFIVADLAWDFSGITNVNIDVRNDAGTALAQLVDGSLSPQGAVSGTLQLGAPLETKLGSTPMAITNLSMDVTLDLTAQEPFILDNAGGGARLGEGERFIHLNIGYTHTSKKMTLTGTGQFSAMLGAARMDLNLNAFLAEYDFQDLSVVSAAGTGYVGSGENRMEVVVGYSPATEAILLTGTGGFRTVMGSADMELNLTAFEAATDFTTVEVLNAAGTGYLGNGEDRMDLTVGYSSGSKALDVTGSGTLRTEMGSTEAVLTLSDFHAVYDFEDVSVLSATGSGYIGNGENRMDVAITWAEAAGAMQLTGSGHVLAGGEAIEVDLQLSDFSAIYDFKHVKVLAASGQGFVGSGENSMMVQARYSDTAEAIRISGSGLLSAKMGAVPVHLSMSEFSADYDFETFKILTAAGSGSVGEGVNRMDVAVSYSEASQAMVLTGTGGFRTEMGRADMELNLTAFEAATDFTSVEVLNAEGTGYLGDGDDRIELTVGYASGSKALDITGSGILRTEIGAADAVLTVSDLHAVYDFEDVRVLSAAGSGYIGNGEDRMNVMLGWSEASEAISLTGTGAFHSVIGATALDLELTAFSATYDFKAVRILDAAGSGTFGNGDQCVAMVVSYSDAAQSLRLTGNGALRAMLGETEVALDVTALSLLYNFEEVVVEDVSGAGMIGNGNNRMDLLITYASASQKMRLTGEGAFASKLGEADLELNLSEFSLLYDFVEVEIEAASGAGTLGSGDDQMAVTVTYSDVEDLLLVNGSGDFSATLGAAELDLSLTSFEAACDFLNVYVRDASGSGLLGNGEDRISVAIDYSSAEEALLVSGAGAWSTAMGEASMDLVLSDFQVLYDFQDVRVLRASGSGRFGTSDQNIALAVQHDAVAGNLILSGSGTMSAPMGDASMGLNLTDFAASYDFDKVAVLHAAGSGWLGLGSNRVDLAVSYEPGSQSLALMGSGTVACAVSGAELVLNLDVLDCLYDFNDVTVREAVGSGLFGDSSNHIAVAVGYSDAVGALHLTGSGALSASMGQAGLELSLTTFDALYDFQTFVIRDVAGSGALGLESSSIAIAVSYSAQEKAMELAGSGDLRVALGTVDLDLALQTFRASYDFENVQIKEADGTGTIGDGTNTMSVAITYLEGSRTLGLSGSGHLGFASAGHQVDMTLTTFTSSYDFEEFQIIEAVGTGSWGDGVNDITFGVDYNGDGRALRLSGAGHLQLDSGGFNVALQATDFEALYDFESFSVQTFDGWGTLAKDDVDLALAQIRLDASQVLYGQFTVTGSPSFDSNGFQLHINALDAAGKLDLTTGEFELLSGRADFAVGGIAGMDGTVGLMAAFSPEEIEAGLSGTSINLSAVGCDLEHASLSVTMTTEFELIRLEGELDAAHPELNAEFEDVYVLIEYGALEQFSIGNAVVDYRGFEFALSSAQYQKNVGVSFSTYLAVQGLGDLDVDEFALTLEGGVSVGGVDGHIERNPVEAHFVATFEETSFSGQFDGTFPPDIDIVGGVEIGTDTDGISTYAYVYLFLDTDLGPTGVPLGPTGLKLASIAGELGINYDASETVGPPWMGEPARDTHSIGLGLGIGDAAGLMELDGFARLTLGPEATSLFLVGSLQVTASEPYFYGQMTVNYVFGETRVWGDLSSQVKVPSNGSIVDLGPGNINYQLDNNEWFMVGSLEGRLFNTDNIQVWGKCNLRGSMDHPISSMTGMIGAGIDAAMYDEFAYPSSFDPSSCSRAQDTDNWVGFGFKGEYDVYGGGEVRANLYEDGITGYFTVYAGFYGSVMTKWPCGLFGCGDSCVSTYWLSADGRLTAEQNYDNMHVYGYLAFAASGGLSEEGELDFYWEQ